MMAIIDRMVEEFKKVGRNESDSRVDVLIDQTQKDIVFIAMNRELKKMSEEKKEEQ